MTKYCRKSPCNNCPYRKDAPLKLWHISEYRKLLEMESSEFGVVYGCHKNDGHVCVGWLMIQDQEGLPSIKLRLSLSINNITRDYLDKLFCKSELYKSVEEMIKANYPKSKILLMKKFRLLQNKQTKGFTIVNENSLSYADYSSDPNYEEKTKGNKRVVLDFMEEYWSNNNIPKDQRIFLEEK